MEIDKETLIYTVIGSIPKGQVASYGQIAAIAGVSAKCAFSGAVIKANAQRLNNTLA